MLTEQYSQLGLSEDQLATVIQAWEADGRLDAMDPDASPVRSEERTLATPARLGLQARPRTLIGLQTVRSARRRLKSHVQWFLGKGPRWKFMATR